MLAFDNLSYMPPWISDALCRLASGGSFAARRLFTDEDEVLLSAARPVVLNGIEEVITRPDSPDRAIFLTLGPITEQKRWPERISGRTSSATSPAFWVRCSISWRMDCDLSRGPDQTLAANG
jgi:hypothetical protein